MSSEFVASEITPLRRPDSNVSTATRLNATNNNNHTTNRNNNLNNNNNINNNNITIETRTQQQNIEMDRNQWIVYRRILIDVFVLLCVGLPILFFYLWGEPYKRGFFCDDESIRHPFHDSTIRNWMLYIIGFILPLAIMITTEYVLSAYQGSTKQPTKILSWNIAPWMVELYKTVGIFAFGAVVSQLTVDIAKYTIGRLRPHFISVCQPLMPNNTNCSSPENIGRYIEEFECLGINSSPRMLKEMRLSFPSGHSSITMYTMIYCVIYLNCRMTWRGSKLLKHALQFLLVMIAWFTALSRISNYKHHWSDVLAGGVIGSLFALVVANYVSDLFDQKSEKPFRPSSARVELGTQIPANGHV